MWEKSRAFRSGRCNVQKYMRPLLDLIASGRLKPGVIISHRMKLDQAAEAYKMFDAREATKIVLTPYTNTPRAWRQPIASALRCPRAWREPGVSWATWRAY